MDTCQSRSSLIPGSPVGFWRVGWGGGREWISSAMSAWSFQSEIETLLFQSLWFNLRLMTFLQYARKGSEKVLVVLL